MLSMYVNTDHKNWGEVLPYVTFAYNTSRLESTGVTPFYLLYGREVVLSADIEFQIKMPTNLSESDYGVQVKEHMTQTRKAVMENLHRAHIKKKNDVQSTMKRSFVPTRRSSSSIQVFPISRESRKIAPTMVRTLRSDKKNDRPKLRSWTEGRKKRQIRHRARSSHEQDTPHLHHVATCE